MRGPAVRPIVIAAGGTGGHISPAEAVASELIARGQRIALVTDARAVGANSPVFAGREQFVIRGAGLAGRGPLRAGRAILSLAAGAVEARAILKRIGAACVLGFGGYPSVAPVVAARLLRERPCVILHEQNAVLGRANRILASHADMLALSFTATQGVPASARCRVTGNPVRASIVQLGERLYAPPNGALNVLVLGGSLGARIFSDVVPAALRALPNDLRVRISVSQQCRPEDLDRVRAAYAADRVDVELAAFFPDVAAQLERAHLVIARAGASTVAELAVAGRPSILVPLPGAIDDHQSANARALSDAGAARVIAQHDLNSSLLTEVLLALLRYPDTMVRAARAARSIARPEAASRLADLVESLMHQEVRT